jgi:uncharacterized protein (TIGR02246 family)
MRSFLALLLILAAVPACQKETTPSAFESLSVKTAIDSLWTGYAHASDTKDAAAFGALFTEDATITFSGVPTAHGRDAIGALLVKLYADIDATGLRVQPDETRVSGTLAVQIGSFEESFTEKGEEKIEYDRYVLVAEQGDGEAWKIRGLVAIADSTK